ncbi:MAG: hypothetical protein NZ811_00710, partial [Gammaproteobacteria bacterium]|nr:hypothetical protein [Gammaproteobacteria bacterium]
MADDFSGMTEDDWDNSDYFDEADYRSVHGASNVGDFSWDGQDMWNTSAAQSDSMHGLLGGGYNAYSAPSAQGSTNTGGLLSQGAGETIQGVNGLAGIGNLGAINNKQQATNPFSVNNRVNADNTIKTVDVRPKDLGMFPAGHRRPSLADNLYNMGKGFVSDVGDFAKDAVKNTVGGPAINWYNNMARDAGSTATYDPTRDVNRQMGGNIVPDLATQGVGLVSILSNPLAAAKEAIDLTSGAFQNTLQFIPGMSNLSWNLENEKKAEDFGKAVVDKYGTMEGFKKALAEEPVSTVGMITGLGYISAKAAAPVGKAIGKQLTPEAVDAWMTKTPGLMAMPKKDIIGFHGTKYDLANNKFDINKVGTGQGMATYGHGIYIAQNPKVAGVYQAELSGDKMYDTLQTKDGTSIADYMNKDQVSDHALHVYFKHQGDLGKTISELQDKAANSSLTSLRNLSTKGIPFIEDFVKTEKPTWKGTGKLYEVDVPDSHIANMLNHDTTLISQPKHIQQIAYARGLDLNITGNDLYRHLTDEHGSKKAASAFLNENGIKGIKYLDGDSRNSKFVLSPPDEVKAGDWMVKDNMRPNSEGKHFATEKEAMAYLETAKKGTSNFVVFDDSILTVLKKNGEFVENVLDVGGKITTMSGIAAVHNVGLDALKSKLATHRVSQKDYISWTLPE